MCNCEFYKIGCAAPFAACQRSLPNIVYPETVIRRRKVEFTHRNGLARKLFFQMRESAHTGFEFRATITFLISLFLYFEHQAGYVLEILTQISILFGSFLLLVGMSVVKDKLSK
jgi:hypothetical protein